MNLREDEAARAVIKAVEAALADQRRLIGMRLLDEDWKTAAGQVKIDRAQRAMVAEQAAQIARGPWRKFIEDGINQGAAAIGFDMSMISREQIEIILRNAEVDIKDLLDSAVPLVNRIILNAVVNGATLRDLSREIEKKLVLDDGLGVSRARADLIARSELMSAYRQAAKMTGDKAGAEYWEAAGPMDNRTTDICRHFNGKVLSSEDWREVASTVFSYGLHYGCRRSFRPVKNPTQAEISAGKAALAAW
jgi:SPP1 gp7 family putative phage head morphogenesis protein